MGSVLLAAALLGSATLATPAAAKKGKSARLDITQPVNAPIPDRAAPMGVFGLLASTIEAGGKFKGKRIRDVNLTVQTIGVTGMLPSANLIGRLTAPNGATTRVFSSLTGSVGSPSPSIGPLTLDDESPLRLGTSNPIDPTALYAPWSGSAQPSGAPLSVMDNGPVRGTWTLRILDGINTQTSVLSSWRLQVVTGRPYETK